MKSMHCETTDLGLSSNLMTMGMSLDFSMPLFSPLSWMRGLISQSHYEQHVMQIESLASKNFLNK